MYHFMEAFEGGVAKSYAVTCQASRPSYQRATRASAQARQSPCHIAILVLRAGSRLQGDWPPFEAERDGAP